jgi:hypothetical protein
VVLCPQFGREVKSLDKKELTLKQLNPPEWFVQFSDQYRIFDYWYPTYLVRLCEGSIYHGFLLRQLFELYHSDTSSKHIRDGYAWILSPFTEISQVFQVSEKTILRSFNWLRDSGYVVTRRINVEGVIKLGFRFEWEVLRTDLEILEQTIRVEQEENHQNIVSRAMAKLTPEEREALGL